MTDEKSEKRNRGHGRGSSFFALGKDVWTVLWTCETTNRLNLISAYLVLLAGTGSDHRLTKWSAKACEQYLGMGKPRARHAIEELIVTGLVKRTEASTKMMPQYELPTLPLEDEPIFLPVQLVTGLAGETPVLRRVRETGDALLLRMLIDLYGLIELDATHAVPIAALRQSEGHGTDSAAYSTCISTTGAHAVWAIRPGTTLQANGDWVRHHAVPAKKKGGDTDWEPFWERVKLLKQLGAIYYEPWVFDSAALDAEPLMPLDSAGMYDVQEPDDEGKLTRLAFDVSRALTEEQPYLMDSHGDADFFIPLTLHQQAPAVRYVVKLRVEADTPGRRLAWRRRRILIEQRVQAYQQLLNDVADGRFDRPMRLGATQGEAA